MSGQGWQVRWRIQLEEDVDLPQCHMMKDRMLVAGIVLVVVVVKADLVAQANQFESDLGQCKGENLSHPYHLAEPTPLVHPNNTNFQVLTR
jgi:hypothetical protein